MIIDVELMYLPFGAKESGQFTWHKVTKKVSIEKGRCLKGIAGFSSGHGHLFLNPLKYTSTNLRGTHKRSAPKFFHVTISSKG